MSKYTRAFILPNNGNNRSGQSVIVNQALFGSGQGLFSHGQLLQTQALQMNVDQFIFKNGKYLQRQQQFKQLLNQKIITSRQQVYQWNLQQISDFFPWLYSSKYLFQPFRTILYCFKQKISTQQLNLISQTITPQMLDQVANKAIFQSIKYQASYLQQAKSYFLKNYLGFFSKNMKKFGQSLRKVLDFVSPYFKAAGNAVYSFFKYILDLGNEDFNFNLQNGNRSNFNKEVQTLKKIDKSRIDSMTYAIQQLLKVLYGNLKPYGQILVNFSWLKQVGGKKVINNKIFYYVKTEPIFYFTLQNAICKIYTSQMGITVLVPQQKMTYQYLRNIIRKQMLTMGQQLTQQWKMGVTDPKLYNNKQNFKKKFLKVENKTASSISQYKQLRKMANKKKEFLQKLGKDNQ